MKNIMKFPTTPLLFLQHSLPLVQFFQSPRLIHKNFCILFCLHQSALYFWFCPHFFNCLTHINSHPAFIILHSRICYCLNDIHCSSFYYPKALFISLQNSVYVYLTVTPCNNLRYKKQKIKPPSSLDLEALFWPHLLIVTWKMVYLCPIQYLPPVHQIFDNTQNINFLFFAIDDIKIR